LAAVAFTVEDELQLMQRAVIALRLSAIATPRVVAVELVVVVAEQLVHRVTIASLSETASDTRSAVEVDVLVALQLVQRAATVTPAPIAKPRV
jgi:hypothetical protein